MKYLTFLLTILLSVQALSQESAEKDTGYLAPIYQFKVKDINGKEFDFGCLEGKKILIINTASKCMYGPQLHDLQKLYEKYKDRDFIVIAFPSNSFAKREPKGNRDISLKYKKKYGITFPVMSKVIAKGDSIEPIYDYLTNKAQNGINDNPVKWNFQKYLIDENGYLVKTIEPKVNPLNEQITDWIEHN